MGTWVDNVDKAFDTLKAEVEVLKKKADDNFPSPMKVNELPRPVSSKWAVTHGWKIEGGYWSSPREPNTAEEVDNLLQKALSVLTEDIQKLTDAHNANLPAIENNLKIHEKVSLLMRDTLKIPSGYSTYAFKSSRSSKKTETRHTAGYIGDLQRNIITSDGYEMKLRDLNAYPETFKRIANDLKGKIRAVEVEQEKEQKAKKEVLAKARLQVKYGLTEDSEWSDVLDALDSKCKYFKLARAMENTRNDWNDGYGRVQYAISAFPIDSPEDQEIFDEIHDLAYEYEDVDGRIFRDCTHNYSFLYGKVDEELMKDYNTLYEYYEAW